MKRVLLKFLPTIVIQFVLLLVFQKVSGTDDSNVTSISIQKFGVLPGNSAEVNRTNLQKAIDWASVRGAALFVEPAEDPYEIASGLILKKNVSLIGVHGPLPRGTRHPEKQQPVGSVF